MMDSTSVQRRLAAVRGLLENDARKAERRARRWARCYAHRGLQREAAEHVYLQGAALHIQGDNAGAYASFEAALLTAQRWGQR